MTEVEKVSIGGYAFTLEVKAYALVKQYLEELEAHYSQLESGSEVMEGIEERMAELLYEKCADDGVASVEMIDDIIATLGKPSAIESESDPEPKKAEAPAGLGKVEGKKRLYRDPTNKILGGVCSGLAAYFKLDVVWFRIIFIGLLAVGLSIHGYHGHWDFHSYGFVSVLAYVALWIAMPEARTVKQRWEMGVTNPPAGSQPAGHAAGQVLRIILGALLMLAGVSGMTFCLASIFGFNLFGWELVHEMGADFLEDLPGHFPLLTNFFYKVDVLLVIFLPLIAMLYGGIMMVFDLRSPKWRPGLVIFLVWVAALIIFTVLTIMGMIKAGAW